MYIVSIIFESTESSVVSLNETISSYEIMHCSAQMKYIKQCHGIVAMSGTKK